MYGRRKFPSPLKRERSLTIVIYKGGDNSSATPPASASSSTSDEKKVPEYKSLNEVVLPVLNTDSIKAMLESALAELEKLTHIQIAHYQQLAKPILENLPFDILNNAFPESATKPLVSLDIQIADTKLTINCQTLLEKISPFFGRWLDNESKQSALKKLNHVTTIYHYIKNATRQPVEKITSITTYLEKSAACQDMREVRTSDEQKSPRLPGDTEGGKYIRAITTIIDNCMVEIENFSTHASLKTLTQLTAIRLEWLSLHYYNSLADKTLQILTKLDTDVLAEIQQKFTNYDKADNRVMQIERPLPDSSKQKFKIYDSVLLDAINYFPSSEHDHIKQSHIGLQFLTTIEEVNPVHPAKKIEDFFNLMKLSMLESPTSGSCLSTFWKAKQSEAETFRSNITKIQHYYGRAKEKFPDEIPNLSPASTSPVP